MKNILHLHWLLTHMWEVFGRAQGLVQNHANNFSSHRRELDLCIWGCPRVLGVMQPTYPVYFL